MMGRRIGRTNFVLIERLTCFDDMGGILVAEEGEGILRGMLDLGM